MPGLTLPPTVASLRCIGCGLDTTDPWQWSCPRCGPESRMDVVYVPAAATLAARAMAGRPFDLWRYRELLPIPVGAVLPPLAVGGTPVHEAPRLAERLGVHRVVVKDECRNPSASLKDRASAIAVAQALASGQGRIACASTGNAASSAACLAASVGLPTTIFVPRRAAEAKIAQLLVFGAQVFRVDADYDATWALAARIMSTRPWYDRNAAVNPYLVEGKKTVALELAEQLGSAMPDWVAVSVGDGCTLAGVVKGLEEAVEMGLIATVPRVLGVQAAGAAPLVHAWQEDRPARRESAATVAESICVGHPRNGAKALAAVRRSRGAMIAVSDASILQAMRDLARLAAVFAEAAGAAAAAGVAEAVRTGRIDADQSVALLVTGSGLKDVATVIAAVDGPIDVAPDLAAVERQLG